VLAIPRPEKNGVDLDNRLIEALRVLKVSRLRECLICKRLFWARRFEARQCGNPRCKSALSSMLLRTPELRQKYYQNRKEREAGLPKRKTKRAKTVPKH
jgi:hypothetical protein